MSDYPSPVYNTNADASAEVDVPQAAIADLTAAPTESDFNGLLAALRSAGILAAS